MVDAPVLQGRDGDVDDRRRGRGALLPTPPATQGEVVSLILGTAYVVAFPEGSKGWPDRGGTADCVRQSRRAGLRVGVVGSDGLVAWDRS